MTHQELLEAQLRLEERQAGLGMERYYREKNLKITKSEESMTVHGRRMMATAIVPLTKRIEDFLAEVNTGVAGKRHRAASFIARVKPGQAALLTLKAILDVVSVNPVFPQVCARVGRMIELEDRLGRVKKTDPLLMKKLDKHVKQFPQARQQSIMVHALNKHEVDLNWEPWPVRDKVRCGLALVTMALEVCDCWFTTQQVRAGRKKTVKIVVPTSECLDLISRIDKHCEFLTPMYLPTVVPPKAWEGPVGGGYHSDVTPTVTLVKSRSSAYQEELRHAVDQMSAVYEAVNAIQATPWRINQDVLECLKYLWETGGNVAGVPRTDQEPLPPKPADIAHNEQALEAWKKEAAPVHKRNASLISTRLLTAKVVWVAEMMRDYPAIYFPHQLDFRGRVYPMPEFLQPQGNDLAKACLEFAEGKPIQTQEQADWLAIHLANCYGYDKASLEDRVAWVVERNEQIRSIAAEPLDDLTWAEADKPFQFLAACFEWAKFLDQGFGFVSHAPVAMDGSNNGLQNFAGMLRDEISGAATNLVPAEVPQDIYQVVADKVIAVLKRLARKGDVMAAEWLAFGVTRKTCKRPVMVLPYGGTIHSCRKYIRDYIEETAAKSGCPWEDTMKAAGYLSELVWDAIGTTVVAAREAMDWLQKTARVVSKSNLPIAWVTPSGFPVVQAYRDIKVAQVKTVVGGSVRLRYGFEQSTLDKVKQANGISPNFVHSLDATHMMMSVVRAKQVGVTSFRMIHDDYGTHAADAPAMARCLREAFVDLYQNNDVLADLAAELAAVLPDGGELPPLPRPGSLDIRKVLEARYFFA